MIFNSILSPSGNETAAFSWLEKLHDKITLTSYCLERDFPIPVSHSNVFVKEDKCTKNVSFDFHIMHVV